MNCFLIIRDFVYERSTKLWTFFIYQFLDWRTTLQCFTLCECHQVLFSLRRSFCSQYASCTDCNNKLSLVIVNICYYFVFGCPVTRLAILDVLLMYISPPSCPSVPSLPDHWSLIAVRDPGRAYVRHGPGVSSTDVGHTAGGEARPDNDPIDSLHGRGRPAWRPHRHSVQRPAAVLRHVHVSQEEIRCLYHHFPSRLLIA